MCIIAAIKKGGILPDDSTVQTMWENNPDGAGVMWADGGKVHGIKGLMTLEALKSAIKYIPHGAAAVLHLRIATSGGIRPEMCHPWPVSGDINRLTQTRWSGAVGFAHNGVLPGLGCKTLSDTGEYIRDVVHPLMELTSYNISDVRALSVLRATSIGSRFAILDASGKLEITGNGWETDENGILYSNGSYKQRTWTNPSWSKFVHWYSETEDVDDDIIPLYGTDAYIINDTGELEDPDDYGIDPDGTIYLYDAGDESGPWWWPCDDYRAYTLNGRPLKWEDVCESCY